MKKIFVFTVLLTISVICSAQNFEGFETGNFLSYNWQFSGSTNWDITYENPYNGVYCAHSGQIYDDEFSRIQVSMETISAGDISFYWRVSSEEDSDFLKFYVDNVEISSISGESDWLFFSENIEPGIHTFTWSYEKDSFNIEGVDKGWLDSITFPETTTYPNDLAALSVVGPATISQGNSGVYNVHIKNYGSNDQDSYTVRLFREGGILLDELVIDETLYSEEAIILPLVWIVPPDEPYALTYVYAEVVLPGDEDPNNNITSNFDVLILEIGLAQIRVGYETNKTNWYPFKFHKPASLSETIYYSTEIQYNGNIHAIGYQNDFLSYVQNAYIQIWIGGTTLSNLANNWVGANALDPVYDGTFSFPQGNNPIIIPFDEPYAYTGGNLCVLTHRVHSTNTYHVDDEFLETYDTNHPNRTRAAGSNNPLNPSSPPTAPNTSYVFSRFPNTTFYMELTELGNLVGNIYDSDGGLISTANIILEQYGIQTYSNGSGFYQFGNVLQGTYNFTASKPGYNSNTQSGTIITDETTTLDFYLDAIPTVQITGHIVASDDQSTGLPNAVLNLSGFEHYQTQSDDNGDFIFPEVYISEVYNLVIQKYGFENYIQEVEVMENDIDLGTIVLNELAFPAENVVGVQNLANTEISLTWDVPFVLNRDLESYTIYRFLEVYNSNPSGWNLLEENYTDTVYIDNGWAALPNQTYQYSIVANYTAGIVSDAAFSNILVKTGVGTNDDLIIPAISEISSVYPNPFNPETTISYSLAEDAELEINIYNVKGQLVMTLVNSKQTAGEHTVIWSGVDSNDKNQSSGIYLIRLQVNGRNISNRKCILMK